MTAAPKKPSADPLSLRETDSAATRYFDVTFYRDWCKACGLCMAFCPKKIIHPDKSGKPVVTAPDQCIGCRFCEMHCPDFTITVSERRPKRRKDDV